ncbi:uncharacterized protein LOC103511572 [Diaphorina citri]|uniref:Methylated-DNA--protein-cysteine methyltransferase n=1 Tax=Diaphorina citri TaxID=121845 RepID=A0A1S3D4X8_DIACI|nr:uncharacterized protein LOC103511572 [Diaphorina citri]
MTMERTKETCLVALNESSCIGTKMLIAYYDKSCIIQAIMFGANPEYLYVDLTKLYSHIEYIKMFESKQSRDIIDRLEAYIVNPKQNCLDIKFKIEGTDFQKLVWSELCKIPFGSLCSYADVARNIGRPKSARAVANACGQNNIPILIPCHRVIRSDGSYGGYSSGKYIKETLIKIEQKIVSEKIQVHSLF